MLFPIVFHFLAKGRDHAKILPAALQVQARFNGIDNHWVLAIEPGHPACRVQSTRRRRFPEQNGHPSQRHAAGIGTVFRIPADELRQIPFPFPLQDPLQHGPVGSAFPPDNPAPMIPVILPIQCEVEGFIIPPGQDTKVAVAQRDAGMGRVGGEGKVDRLRCV